MENNHTMLKAFAIHKNDVEGIKKTGFYIDKIIMLEERLREIANKYTAMPIIELVKIYQDALLKTRQELEFLKNNFRNEEFKIAYKLERLGKNADPDLQKARELQEKIRRYEENINLLGVRVNNFLSKLM